LTAYVMRTRRSQIRINVITKPATLIPSGDYVNHLSVEQPLKETLE